MRRSKPIRGRVSRLAFVTSVAIAASAWSQDADVPFTLVTIDENPPSRPWFKMTGDINGDGFTDLVVGGARGPLVWYAHPDWKRSSIAEGGWNGVNGELGDIDRDGDLDIVMGGIVWFSNPRLGGGSWRMTQIDQRTAHDIELGDLDRDGRLDVVARDQSAFGGKGNGIYLYRQRSPLEWSQEQIVCPHGEGLKLGDMDLDGDLDIVIGGRWYENRPGQRWAERVYAPAWTEPDTKVDIADLDGDERPDVVLTPAELRGQQFRVAWYQSPPDPRSPEWQEHVIVAAIEAVIHSLGVGDFDRDGDIDVAIAEMHQGADPDQVMLLINQDRGTRWRKQILSNDGSHDMVVSDIGEDGDLDILGANHAGNSTPLELWVNGTVD